MLLFRSGERCAVMCAVVPSKHYCIAALPYICLLTVEANASTLACDTEYQHTPTMLCAGPWVNVFVHFFVYCERVSQAVVMGRLHMCLEQESTLVDLLQALHMTCMAVLGMAMYEPANNLAMRLF